MVAIALICHREQALIEPALIGPALVSPNQQDRLSLRIEGIVKENGPSHG